MISRTRLSTDFITCAREGEPGDEASLVCKSMDKKHSRQGGSVEEHQQQELSEQRIPSQDQSDRLHHGECKPPDEEGQRLQDQGLQLTEQRERRVQETDCRRRLGTSEDRTPG